MQSPMSIAQAQSVNEPSSEQIERRELDRRAVILQAYLAKHKSPMQNHAADFVEAADTYNLDWKLVPAIAGVESTFGKHIPGGYNGWGWGVYGTNRIYFTSWRDGIFTVSQGLRTRYFDRGLTEPYAINKVYAASPHWGKNVTFFINDISKFEAEYNRKYPVSQLAALPDYDYLGLNTLPTGKFQ